MSFILWGINGWPYMALPSNGAGYLVLAAYVLILMAAVAATFRDFANLDKGRRLLMAGLIAAAPVLTTIFQIHFPGTVAPPGVPAEPSGPTLSFLGYVPIVLAAGLVGTGPAILVGVAAGLARAGWQTYRITTIFEAAFAAGLIGGFIRQRYRGLLPRISRLPLISAIFTAALVWLLSYLSYLANSTALGFIGLDYITSQWYASALPLAVELLLGGLLGTLAASVFPTQWAPRSGDRPPPYAYSLNRRLSFTLMPLSFVGLLVLIYATSRIANQVATALIVDQMGRDAESVANSVPYFAQTGQSLLESLAADSRLQDPDTAAVDRWLGEQIRAVPFFRTLAYFDNANTLIAAYAPGEQDPVSLSSEERAALERGFPQSFAVYPRDRLAGNVVVSFVVPVVNAQGAQSGALVGRSNIEENPLLKPTIDQLKSLSSGSGRGFIVDDQNNIIFHPDRTRLMQSWTPSDRPEEPLRTDVPGGMVYRDRAPGNTRELVFYLPVSGYPWSVVVTRSNEVVEAKANQITAPLIIILVVIGGLGAGAIVLITNQITRPLEALVRATAGIAQGEFDRPVQLSGEDEVGRLGVAFERMRERLRERLGELNLLLHISQGIAGSLNLDQSLPPVLEGALAATRGGGVRLLIAGKDGAAPAVYAAGPLSAAMQPLDKDLLALTETEGRVVLENIARARAVLDVSKAAGQVQALIALPLRQHSRFLGALWIGFPQHHPFTESEVNFVSTLTGQAALAVSNAQLYEASEGGRQQLQAILASSPDAVIVTDRRENILLLNPAAESIFGVTSRLAQGRPLAEVIDRRELVEVIRSPDTGAPRQVPLADGRTLFASASPIAADDGSPLGTVAVLRDVTYFKQLDELKSEFVATVSHDLRVPLTFMRGYATMLPMVGQLNAKQSEFANKIVIGIEQMSELIEALLDLNRIEAGVDLAREACSVEEMVGRAVENFRNNALNKDISLTTQIARGLPLLSGDRTLLQQAISNLVDNAIKYTPSGGRVRVMAEQREQNMIIAVQDSGIGIAPSDQLRLFEKFFRVKQRDTIAIKGSGLGLAIVKSIVERHHGQVWVESRLGQGSIFFMSVPI